MLTLWDLLKPARKPKPRPEPRRAPVVRTETATKPRSSPMADKYERVTRDMLRAYGVRVRKWRTSMSGCAWEVHGSDGSVGRLIESPRPKGPMSAAVFLHEIGHHAIGFNRYRPRCLEEYHAWAFAIEQMERLDLNVTDNVRKRMHNSLHYAVAKAARRGLKRLPAELLPYVEPYQATLGRLDPPGDAMR